MKCNKNKIYNITKYYDINFHLLNFLFYQIELNTIFLDIKTIITFTIKLRTHAFSNIHTHSHINGQKSHPVFFFLSIYVGCARNNCMLPLQPCEKGGLRLDWWKQQRPLLSGWSYTHRGSCDVTCCASCLPLKIHGVRLLIFILLQAVSTLNKFKFSAFLYFIIWYSTNEIYKK